MEKKGLEIVDNELTQSFCKVLLEWRANVRSVTFPEYLTCFSYFVFASVQDILLGTGIVEKRTNDMVLEDMHDYLQIAGESALANLVEKLGKEERSSEDGSSPDNGYFEKFEDD